MVPITKYQIVWLKTKTLISQSSGGRKSKKVRKSFLSSFFLQLAGHLLCLHVPFSPVSVPSTSSFSYKGNILFGLESHSFDFISP